MVHVRRATESDAVAMWEWRNDPATRAASLSPEVVTWSDHIAWFNRALTTSTRTLYIGESSGLESAVGMCRFDVGPDLSSAEVSINMNPSHRGKRLSHSLLDAAISRFLNESVQTERLVAVIRQTNAPSKKLFASAGFALASIDGTVETHVLELGR